MTPLGMNSHDRLDVFPPGTGPWHDIHDPFFPGDVRPGDPIYASVTLQTEGPTLAPSYAMQVWRISPLGIELVSAPHTPFEGGSEITLQLRMGRQTSEFHGLVVNSRYSEGGRQLIGIRWCPPQSKDSTNTDRRSARRWLCGDEFLPTGVAPNPIRFADFIHFRVHDVSSQGMQLLTSMRNRFVVPGMLLDGTFSFPMIGQVKMACRIAHAEVFNHHGKDYLALGVRMEDATPAVRQMIGQYVLQFGTSATVEELRSAGLQVRSSTQAVDFGFVRTADEYRQVLGLRQLAYQRAGKLAADVTPEQMGDIYDGRARILIGRYRGEVVASLRMMFHEAHEPTEHEQYVSLPNHCPDKTDTVEVTRVCTHPSYRGSDLLMGLVRHGALTVLQSGRRYVLGSATDKLLPFYLKLGFKSLGLRYRNAAVGGDEHVIFVGNISNAMEGKGIGPLSWNVIFGDIWGYLNGNGLLRTAPDQQLRLGIYRLFRPLAQVLMARANRPRAHSPSSKHP